MKSSGRLRPRFTEKIYHELIPNLAEPIRRALLAELSYGGNDHNSAEEGDRHNWQVWHGMVEPRRFGEPPRVDYSVEGVSSRTSKRHGEISANSNARRKPLHAERNIPPGRFGEATRWPTETRITITRRGFC